MAEPNLYVGTESGDCMSVELRRVTRDQQHINVPLHSPLERYVHREKVETLVATYGTMGCQGILKKVFSGEDHHENEFRQGVACSLVLSIGQGYSSPWNYIKNNINEEKVVKGEKKKVNNDLCVLVHLVLPIIY